MMERTTIYTFTLALITLALAGPLMRNEVFAWLGAIYTVVFGPIVIGQAFSAYRFTRRYGRRR